jgi:DNA-binding transcriptional regulator YhcF (GntR family)
MEIIENDILSGVYKPHDLIISTTQISKLYSVNPTTAVKAVSRLTEEGVLYKKPGIGMCVTEDAREKIFRRRQQVFLGGAIDAFLSEAAALGISVDEIISIIRKKDKGING